MNPQHLNRAAIYWYRNQRLQGNPYPHLPDYFRQRLITRRIKDILGDDDDLALQDECDSFEDKDKLCTDDGEAV